MASYSNELYPVHGLNQFLWTKLQELDCMKPNFYRSTSGGNTFNWIPIMPTRQVVEFTQSTDVDRIKAPYIVYNWRTEQINQNWFIQSDQVAYIIYSNDDQKIRDVSKTIIDLCKRWDESAELVNKYMASYGRAARYSQYHYKNISVVSATGPEPADEPGGNMQSVLTVRITYTDNSHFKL